ncbi:MAG: Fic family protein [Ardenticatenales bacterium]|nr:Fic family protein [Ardenticatenales bacterium]
MKRTATGTYEVTTVSGEPVRAFVPHPLPPKPHLSLDGSRQVLLERAVLALGRLDSIASLLPDPHLLLYAYVRKEAVLSSQIEGTQSSLSNLLLFELDSAPGVPMDDVVEVSNYVAALQHGMDRLAAGFPLSNRLLKEIHEILLSSGRGSTKHPGEFRRSQNWIGGPRPGMAHFVPPPPHAVAECMGQLELFLNDETTPLPILVKAGLAHVQFETIHPFLDGNGRVGRLLITLFLCQAGILRHPLLYLSLHFKTHRSEYYRLLDAVREHGDWETWIDFFLQGVKDTAEGAVATARRLVALFDQDRNAIHQTGRAASSALRVHAVLCERALTSLTAVVTQSGLSFPAASAGMKVLTHLGIARELTGGKRNRIYTYHQYVTILNEGTEPY